MYELGGKAITKLREEGLVTFARNAVRFLFWRRSVIEPLPVSLLTAIFEVRSWVYPDVSDANPLRLRWVDPEDIEYLHAGRPKQPGLVLDGDWDTPAKRFVETAACESIQQRYEDGRDWSETPLYEYYRERIERGDPSGRVATYAELEAYFTRIDRLYERIKSKGYRSQRDLLAEDPTAAHTANNDTIHPALNEIGVNIYRDGTLAKKTSGNHRLAIARVLGIERVPVVVRTRHAEWQAIRDEIREAESRDRLDARARRRLDHPDLTDVVPVSWKEVREADTGA